MSTDQGKRLQKAIDALLVSYNEHQDIEHIGDKHIPAKESIINLILDMLKEEIRNIKIYKN